MSQWMQCNFIQTSPTWADSTCNVIFGRSGLGGDDVPYSRSPHKGWNRKEWETRVKEPGDAIEKTLREAYAELTGAEAPLSVLARIDAITRPVAKQSIPDAPLLIDWRRLAKDYDRAMALFRLQIEERELRAQIEKEEDEILLMLT